MMASGTGCLQRSAARSVFDFAWPRHSARDHPASVPVAQRSVLVERIGEFLFGRAGISSLLQAKLVPSRHRRSITTAILRAAATAAFLNPLRAASRTAHALSGNHRSIRVNDTDGILFQRYIRTTIMLHGRSPQRHFIQRPILSDLHAPGERLPQLRHVRFSPMSGSGRSVTWCCNWSKKLCFRSGPFDFASMNGRRSRSTRYTGQENGRKENARASSQGARRT